MNKSVLLLGLLVACGGDDGDGPQIITPDAPGGGGGNVDAPVTPNCALESSYSTTINEDNGFAASDEGVLSGQGILSMDPDILFVDLFEGYTVFENGITATTVNLSGPEAAFDTCGACVTIAGNAVIDQSSGQITQADDYMATGGTLAITSITGSFTFTLSDVTMQRVMFGEGGATTPVNDGCQTTLSNITFSVPIEAAPALRSKGVRRAIKLRK